MRKVKFRKLLNRHTLMAATAAVMLSMTSQQALAQVPPIRELGLQQIEDMIVGSAIYCSRGTNTQNMIDRIRQAFKEGKKFKMIALHDLPDDWLSFTTFGVGGGGAWPEIAKRYAHEAPAAPGANPYPEQILSDHLGKKFQATFSAEVGQIVTSLMIANRLDIPLIDGDPAARCLPEVQMSSIWVNGKITRAPFAGVTRYGDVILVPHVKDDFRTEDITRALAIASGGGVSIAANAVPGTVLKEHLAPGFHSQSEKVGRAARLAVAAGKDPVAAIVAAGDGFLLFQGNVTRSDTKGERGFGWTDAYIQGTGAFAGSEYKIYVKNENMVAWRDGKLDAAAPDVIAAVDPKTGWAIKIGHEIGSFPVGDEVAIVGYPAVPIWRTPEGIKAQEPRHFGFDEDFVPIEQIHKKKTRNKR